MTGWSKTPPVVPGWYWTVFAGSVEIACVDTHHNTERLYATLTGSEFPYDLDDFPHWLGPLPTPEPPEVIE